MIPHKLLSIFFTQLQLWRHLQLRFILLTKHLEQVTTQRLLDPNS